MAALEEAEFPVWDEFLPLPNGVHNIEASSEEYLQVVPSRQHTHLVEILASGPVYLFEGTAVPTDDAASAWLAAGAHTRVVPAGVALYAKSLAVGAGGDTGGDSGGDEEPTERGLLTLPTSSIGEVTLGTALQTEGADTIQLVGDGVASITEGTTFFFDGEPDSEQTIAGIIIAGLLYTISPGSPFAGLNAGTRLFFGVEADVVPRSNIDTRKRRYNVFGVNEPNAGAASIAVAGLFTPQDDSGLDEIVAGGHWRSTAGDATIYTITAAEKKTDPNSGGIGQGTREYVDITFTPGLVEVPSLSTVLLFDLPLPTLTLRAAAAATTGATTIQVDGLGVDQLAADQTFTAGTDTTEYTITTATALTGANEGKVSLVFSPMLAADIADNAQIEFSGTGIRGIPEPMQIAADIVGDPPTGRNSIIVQGATGDVVVGAFITFTGHDTYYEITAERAFVGGGAVNGKTLTIDPGLEQGVSNDTPILLYMYTPADDSGDDGDGDGDEGTPMAVAAQVCAQVWNDVRFAHGRGGE